MEDSTSRHRAPLIPTISTLDHDSPVASVKGESEEGQTVRVVVIAVIEMGPESTDAASLRTAILRAECSPDDPKT